MMQQNIAEKIVNFEFIIMIHLNTFYYKREDNKSFIYNI